MSVREEQRPAAEALLEKKIGVLSATTSFGKTVVASYLISQRKTNTLILVHTQALMAQWKESIETFLRFDIAPPEEKKGRGRKRIWSPVGVLGAGKDTTHGIVDIAVMQSLVNGDEVKELVRNYGMITGWHRVPENPLVTPTPGTWDEHSCYKPGVIRSDDGTYHIWYNGRRDGDEFIGYATGTIAD